MGAPFNIYFILFFRISCYRGNRNLSIMVQEIDGLVIDRRTDEQRSLSHWGPFYPLGTDGKRSGPPGVPTEMKLDNLCV